METTFDNKVAILAEVAELADFTGEYAEFVEWNDLTFPFVWGLNNGYLILTDKGQEIIDRTFALFLETVEKTDTGFTTLNDLLGLPEVDELF